HLTIDPISFVRGSLDRLDGQRFIVHQEVEAVEPMPGSLLAGLPWLLANGILIDARHCGGCKQPHEESVFHDILGRSIIEWTASPPISDHRAVIVPGRHVRVNEAMPHAHSEHKDSHSR